jgi:predicted transcriptional regulator
MAQVLSSENQKLLRIIKEQKPKSLKELETASGRNRSNLSRTLKTMSRYGIVELVKQKRTVKPVVKATDFKVEFGLDKSFAPQQ